MLVSKVKSRINELMYNYYYYMGSSSPYPTTKHDPKGPKYKRPFRMDCRELRSHARGVYPAQDTTRMGTARGRSIHNVVVVLALYGSIKMRRKYKGASGMDCREQRSHARGRIPHRAQFKLISSILSCLHPGVILYS